MLWMRFPVCALVILPVIHVSVALRRGDPGVIQSDSLPKMITRENYYDIKNKYNTKTQGNDVRDGELICDHNYEFDMGSDSCVPLDDPTCGSCKNGQCVGPEICQCFEGFKKTSEGCEPVCSKPCIHGFCSAPNNCSCDAGYQKTKDVCQPVCVSPCTNGYCSAPNTCTCNPGYHKTKDGCKPVCSPACLNGYCSSPNNCSCNTGYQKEGVDCKPVCSRNCTNGYCTAPDYCTCEDGYKTNQTDYSTCFKPCLTPCGNGSCGLDGKCFCLFDYEFDNDTQTCIPAKPINCVECSGTCLAEGECKCADNRACYMEPPPPGPEPVSMAGLDLTLISIGGACLFLFIVIVVVMQRIWQKRHKYESKPTSNKPVFGSVVYTVPNTLIQSRVTEEDNEGSCEEDSNDTLLRKEAEIP